ncbi:hypothetical protein LEP1GSC125_0042, partial [Leptospira mayottensis 200901122]
VNRKYTVYSEDIQNRIEKQAKANDAEKESKGFLFNVLNGMSGGQKPHEAIKSEVQSRITGAVAEATGLPASFVGALVGGSNMKQAMKAYEKSVTTEAISQATGIPAWYLNQKISEKEATHAMTTSFSYNMGRGLGTMAAVAIATVAVGPVGVIALAANPDVTKKVNKFSDHLGKQAYENRETIDTVITVAASATAIITGGASLVALAAYKTIQGATEGGVLGALAGAATIGNAPLSIATGGLVSYDLSYSREKGFGASVGGGMKLMEGLGVGATLSYNEQTGFGGSAGLQAGTSALSFNAGISYSEQGGISANAGLGVGMGKNATTGSYASTLNLGMSYNRQDGFGTSAGLSSNNNHVLPGMGATISRSEYAGWGADISTDQYGKVEGGGGRPSFGGVSGGLAWSERDGFTASFNVAGTNALSYNSQTGLSSNADFIAQYSMNNILAQGVAETDEEKAYAAAKAEADSRAAQNRNNSENGAAAVSASGYATARREGEDGATPHSNGEPADPVDQRIAQLRKELSEGISLAHDNGTMSDAGNPALASAARELSSKTAELNRLVASKEAGGTTKPASSGSESGGLLDGIKGLYTKTKELIYGPEAKPRSAYADDRSAAQGTRIGNETAAYLDYKEGKISKADYEGQVAAERKAYYEATQGDRNKIPMGSGYTDVSKDNLGKLTHLEGIKGVTGRIVEDANGNVYFRTKADGMGSASIPMEPTKITEKPWTAIDPHNQSKDPGAVDLHAPYGSPMTVMRSDDGKFKVTGLTNMSEGGNSLRLEYKLNGVKRQVDLRHGQNQFPSYVIDALKANEKPIFDNGTVVGWTGVTGQHGIGNDGKVKYDPTDHSHLKFQNSNGSDWKDWGLPAMGY